MIEPGEGYAKLERGPIPSVPVLEVGPDKAELGNLVRLKCCWFAAESCWSLFRPQSKAGNNTPADL